MAAIELINKASLSLETQVNELELIIRMCDSVAGDNPPEWLSMMFTKVVGVSEATQAYMEAVATHALPLMRDMAAISR